MRHAADLWHAVQGHDELWTYMGGYGPFADERAFSAWLAEREPLRDPYYYTVLDANGRACRGAQELQSAIDRGTKFLQPLTSAPEASR